MARSSTASERSIRGPRLPAEPLRELLIARGRMLSASDPYRDLEATAPALMEIAHAMAIRFDLEPKLVHRTLSRIAHGEQRYVLGDTADRICSLLGRHVDELYEGTTPAEWSWRDREHVA